jgi:hypothetical protein
MSPQDWPRASLLSAKYQDSQQSQAKSIFGGTTEIIKEIIGRSLGL